MAIRVIALLGGPPVINEESAANEAITPGHVVELRSDGKVQKNTSAANNVAPAFALERDELGKTIDIAYASGDTVKVGTFRPGQRVYAFLASGQNVARAAYLTTDNAGCLTAASVSATVRGFRALEAVNNTAGPTYTRIRVEVI